MDRRILATFGTVCVMAAGILWISAATAKRKEASRINHERCVNEAEKLVATFLATNQTGSFSGKGPFVRLAGSGYLPPGPWNLQGQFYLNLHRNARFAEGWQEVQIIVQKGESKHVLSPRPESSVIYVTHPGLIE
jgi:hypothetical protein